MNTAPLAIWIKISPETAKAVLFLENCTEEKFVFKFFTKINQFLCK
jgi:hypothetical protein